MLARINQSICILMIAGLLLQLTGSLPLNQVEAATPAETGGRVLRASGEGSLLGFFTAGAGRTQAGEPDGEPPPSLPTPEALPAPEPLPAEQVVDRPPPIEPGGPYYANPIVDGRENLINTNVGGTIIVDTLWTLAGSPYNITSDLTVAAGATLSIEPGVVVNANQLMSFTIQGRLLAQGGSGAGAGISFRGTSATPGWWSGLRFVGSGSNPLTGSILDYVTIADGGYALSYPANLYLYYAEVSLSHATVANGKYNGVYGGAHGVAHISNTTVSNNGTATTDEDYAIWFTDGSVAPELSSLTLSGNSQNAIAFGYGILTTRTWRALGYPYIFTGYQTVPEGATLTVEPGVLARFAQNTSLNVSGQIVAQGGSGAGAGISFRGTSATPGWWSGLRFVGSGSNPLTGSILDYVTIADGGYALSYPANLYLYYAEASLSHATVANGKYNGVYGGAHGVAHISNTTVSNNGTATGDEDYAIWFTDGSVAPELSSLSLSGNSLDGVAFGQGELTTRTWRALGYPYYLTGYQTVPTGATLTVEPGVTVIGDGDTIIYVNGRLEAVGGPNEPILFTGRNPSPGTWQGISFSGNPTDLATGMLNFVTIEYGGGCANCANLKSYYAQVNIRNSKIRNSARDGVQVVSYSTGIVISNSQITGNATFGVRNLGVSGFVMASNNWWGHASGPSTPDSACNVTGTGQAITNRVAFQPYLTSADQQSDEIPVPEVMTISLNPRRYYAPANGTTRVWFEITLRDGAGFPIPGQVVNLRSNLGNAYGGGSTDVGGKVFAYLISSTAGEATVFAELDEQAGCDFLRSATTEISFNAANDDLLSPDAQSPYSNGAVRFDPAPVMAGVPGLLQVSLTNPNNFAIRVNASFTYAQLGLGLIFGPVAEVNDVIIPANSTGLLEAQWTPLASGHFCIRAEYTWEQEGAPPGEGINGAERTLGDGSTQSNTNGGAGPLLRDFDKNAIRKANVATTSLGDISFAAAGLDDIAAVGTPAASAPVGFLQGLMIGNILDFIFEGGGASDCALQGGTSCGGWNGPRLKYPGESLGNLRKDPPSPEYRTLVPLDLLNFTPLQPSAQIPAARAAAINELVRAGMDLSSYLVAAAATYDRYAGAVEASSWDHATNQANAFDYYLTKSAEKMIEVADKMDALVAQLNSEGLKFLLAENDFIAYQQRLATQGFNAQEIEAAHLAGKDDEGIALSLQRRLALNPQDVAGWFDVRMTEAAQAYRELSFALTYEPPFFSVGGRAGRTSGASLATRATAETVNLVRTGEATFSFEVGNPYGMDKTIDLRVRRIDLPADWIITLSADSVTLAPGSKATITARADPGLAGAQGTLPRFAVEGMVDGELLGGVEFSVYLPEYHPFTGSEQVYLPALLTRP